MNLKPQGKMISVRVGSQELFFNELDGKHYIKIRANPYNAMASGAGLQVLFENKITSAAALNAFFPVNPYLFLHDEAEMSGDLADVETRLKKLHINGASDTFFDAVGDGCVKYSGAKREAHVKRALDKLLLLCSRDEALEFLTLLAGAQTMRKLFNYVDLPRAAPVPVKKASKPHAGAIDQFLKSKPSRGEAVVQKEDAPKKEAAAPKKGTLDAFLKKKAE